MVAISLHFQRAVSTTFTSAELLLQRGTLELGVEYWYIKSEDSSSYTA